MNPDNNRKLHALLSELKLMHAKADIISVATNGRTTSSKELSDKEARSIIKGLGVEREGRVKKTRGKIIHLLCLMGYTDDKGNADYKRINEFIKNIGSRNPKKKQLLYLSIKETNAVATQVEMIYKNTI